MPLDPSDAIDFALSHNIPLPEVTETELQQHALEVELQRERARAQAAEARVKHIEQALKTAGRVLEPYLASRRR
jgi:LPS O-antigen subunit length determinant protein (WzzB/FepE family)